MKKQGAARFCAAGFVVFAKRRHSRTAYPTLYSVTLSIFFNSAFVLWVLFDRQFLLLNLRRFFQVTVDSIFCVLKHGWNFSQPEATLSCRRPLHVIDLVVSCADYPVGYGPEQRMHRYALFRVFLRGLAPLLLARQWPPFWRFECL